MSYLIYVWLIKCKLENIDFGFTSDDNLCIGSISLLKSYFIRTGMCYITYYA